MPSSILFSRSKPIPRGSLPPLFANIRRSSFTFATPTSDYFTLNSQSHIFVTLQNTEIATSRTSRIPKASSYNTQNDMNYATPPSARNSSRCCVGWWRTCQAEKATFHSCGISLRMRSIRYVTLLVLGDVDCRTDGT